MAEYDEGYPVYTYCLREKQFKDFVDLSPYDDIKFGELIELSDKSLFGIVMYRRGKKPLGLIQGEHWIGNLNLNKPQPELLITIQKIVRKIFTTKQDDSITKWTVLFNGNKGDEGFETRNKIMRLNPY